MSDPPFSLPPEWPNRQHSRQVKAANLDWHVQILGSGPAILLLHGTGAATHSWARLAPLLAQRFTVVMPDLPGQGFTQLAPAGQCSLAGMARAVAALLRSLEVSPALIVGHSAGAAIAASLCLHGSCNPAAIISINGAMLPFGRVAAPLFTRAARMLAQLPVFPQLIALHAIPQKPVMRMLRQTGSALPEDSVSWYREVVGRPGHVAGTLRMMANWDLPQLEQNLDRLQPQLYLLVCEEDQVVSPAQGEELARRLPMARLESIPGFGHLGHEEDAGYFAAIIEGIAAEQGV